MRESEKLEIINKYMQKLKISKEEAEQLFRSDFEGEEPPEIAALTEKAKVIRRYEQSAKTRANSPRERKVDNDKLCILTEIEQVFTNVLKCTNVNRKTETEIKFSYNGNNYTLKLTKNRK